MRLQPFFCILVAALSASCVMSVAAQDKCPLHIVGYVEDESAPDVAAINQLVRDGRLSGITAYATNWDTGRRYNSVPSGTIRVFGSVPEGDYRVVVGKPGYKTSVASVSVLCGHGASLQSVRLWPGSPSDTVDNAGQRASSMPTLRVVSNPTLRSDTDTTLGSTGSGAQGDDVPPPPPPPKALPKTISGGVLNGKAISLPQPIYPPAANAVRASGTVTVQVLISESGSVISATAVSGHPILQGAAVAAARQARFSPTLLSGQPVKVSGVIVYNMAPK
jgi:TonB family protein